MFSTEEIVIENYHQLASKLRVNALLNIYEIDFTTEDVDELQIEEDIIISHKKHKMLLRYGFDGERIFTDQSIKMQKKFAYLMEKAKSGEIVKFGFIHSSMLKVHGANFWIKAIAIKKFYKGHNIAFFATVDATSDANKLIARRKRKYQLDSIGSDLFFSCINNIYTDITCVDLKTQDVFKVSVENCDVKIIPVKEKWTEVQTEMMSFVREEDVPRFLRYTDPAVIGTFAFDDTYSFHYRSTYLSKNGDERWYFTNMHVWERYALMFTFDETSSIVRQEQMGSKKMFEEDPFKKAIISDAVAVYEYNLTQNIIIGTPTLCTNGKTVSLFETLGLPEDCSFSEFCEEYAKDLSPLEKKKFLEEMNILHLQDSYICGKYEIQFDFSKVGFEEKIFWYRNTIILTKDEISGDIKGLTVVKNITTKYTQEEEKLFQAEIIEGLTREYSNVFMVNLSTGKIRTVRTNDKSGAFYSEVFGEQHYDDVLDFYIGLSVHEDDRDMMHSAFRRENVIEQLSVRESFYVNYRTYINEQLQYMKLKLVRIGNPGEIDRILFGFVNVDEDVKQEMKYKKKLEQALKTAELASLAKSQFLSNMSHDIRTPMNAIVGFTNLAKSHVFDPDEILNYISKIEASSNHLLSLINDVLDMSRIESGKLSLQEVPISMNSIIENVDTVMQSQIQMKNLNYSVERRGNLNRAVLCDKLRMNQILINIIGNSVKYTKVNGSITFSIFEEDAGKENHTKYRLTIKDTGIGMSQKFQEHLFEAFEREETDETKIIQGTGLGLAITKNLVDMMGGKITVNSQEGVGSEFILEFVFENSLETGEIAAGKSTGEINLERFKGKRILLVEDNELNRDIAREILKSVGFELDEACDGKSAIEILQEKPSDFYNIILMDVQMPIMNGYEATKQIRQFKDKYKANLPILAMTANAFEEDRKNAIESGMDSYVTKPFNTQELLKTLDQMLDKKIV